MSRFDDYNAERADRGRGAIRESTFEGMDAVSVFSRDFQFIAGSSAVYAAKLAKAAEVADYWRSISPHWGDSDPKNKKPPSGLRAGGSGVPNYPDDYAASIKVMRRHGTVSVGTELVPLAIFLEYGTEKTPRFACAARTLAYFGGGKVEEEKKIAPGLLLG